MERSEKRILVVDDDDAIRALLFTVLRRRGFKVDTARNGSDALERCATCRYALVLLDLLMPQKSGYDVLREMASWPAEGRPLVVVLTAGSEPRNLDPALVAGTVRKPFDIELLFDMISGCVTAVGAQEQTERCPSPESERPQGPDQKAN